MVGCATWRYYFLQNSSRPRLHYLPRRRQCLLLEKVMRLENKSFRLFEGLTGLGWMINEFAVFGSENKTKTRLWRLLSVLEKGLRKVWIISAHVLCSCRTFGASQIELPVTSQPRTSSTTPFHAFDLVNLMFSSETFHKDYRLQLEKVEREHLQNKFSEFNW